MKRLLALLPVLVWNAAALAAEAAPAARFATPPKATKAGDKVQIDFAVDRETDVAVTIESAAGAVVRHLVAGVLGKNPPAPLKAAGLVQSLVWDGLGDDGKPAAGGPFQARVRLGLAPRLDEYMFDSPDAIGGEQNLGVAPNGDLYLTRAPGGGNAAIAPGMWTRVFDRQGRYLRTIVPFPPNTPLDRLKGTGAYEADGQLYPLFHESAHMRFYPAGDEAYGHETVITAKGHVFKLVIGGPGGPAGYVLRCFNADGSVPGDVAFSGQSLNNGPCCQANFRSWFAVSPDEKWAYLSGATVRAGKDPRQNCVYRVPVDGTAPGKPFVGEPDKSGADEAHLNQPTGVAVDGHGLLYVADFGNDRIQVFQEADGKFVGSVPVKGPTTIQVHPKTGAIYVMAVEKSAASLVKISGRQGPKEVARMPLGRAGDERFGVMDLDRTSEPPILYAGGLYGSTSIRRIEDRGGELVGQELKSKALWPGACAHLNVNRARDELYFYASGEQFVRVELKTGKATPLTIPGTTIGDGSTLAVSPDGGAIYTFSHYQGLRKFDHDLKPANFEALGKNKIDGPLAPMTFSARGLGVAPNGDIYVIPVGIDKGYCGTSEVQVFKPDGTRKGTAVWRLCEVDTGPRFDPQGNIYLAVCAKEPGKPVPDSFLERLPEPFGPKNSQPQTHSWSSATASAAWIYGSIVKFPPGGGAFWYVPSIFPGKSGLNHDVPAEILALSKTKVQTKWQAGLIDGELQGALWSYYGASPFASRHSSGSPCNCQSSGFDVDDFGRTFFPDVARFRIGVLDAAGNPITFFGQYGNRDELPCPVTGNRPDKNITAEDNGRKIALFDQAALAEFKRDPAKYAKRTEGWPRIAFGYPFYVAASRTHVFVGDALNNRIAKLRLDYAADATCAMP